MQSFLTTLLLLCSCFDILGGALGDVGTARYYGPPYLPTKCYGDDQDPFPSDGQFAAVSNGIWDNGAACGRRYRMRCISGPWRPCRNRSIVMEVVDFCNTTPAEQQWPCHSKPLQPSQSQDMVSGSTLNMHRFNWGASKHQLQDPIRHVSRFSGFVVKTL